MTTLVQQPSEERSLDDIIRQCKDIITEIRGERPKSTVTGAVDVTTFLTERGRHGREKQALPVAQEVSVWRTYHHMHDGKTTRETASSATDISRPEMTRQNAVCHENVTCDTSGSVDKQNSENTCRNVQQTIAVECPKLSRNKEKIDLGTTEANSGEKHNAENGCIVKTDRPRGVSPATCYLADNESPCSSIRNKMHYSEKCRQAEKSFFTKVSSQFCSLNKDIVQTVRHLRKRHHTSEPDVKEVPRTHAPAETSKGEWNASCLEWRCVLQLSNIETC